MCVVARIPGVRIPYYTQSSHLVPLKGRYPSFPSVIANAEADLQPGFTFARKGTAFTAIWHLVPIVWEFTDKSVNIASTSQQIVRDAPRIRHVFLGTLQMLPPIRSLLFWLLYRENTPDLLLLQQTGFYL